jgi:cysteine desulfurase / selenocysteine lyase
MARIYLDNAATSFPKPDVVLRAMTDYQTRIGGTAGRGNYFEAREGGRLMNQCRERLCRLIGAPASSWRQVIFTLNTSDALNLAIKGLVIEALFGRARAADRPAVAHVVTTETDHNSILRPLVALAELFPGRVEWTCVPASDPSTGLVTARDLAAALRPDTLLVATLHASNVTGVIQPVAEYGRVCRAARSEWWPGGRLPLLIDAAQSLGHEPVDVTAMGVDLLACPGHKGLLGPLGTGALWIAPGLDRFIRPLREGGTGSKSEQDSQPGDLPDKYECGSQNTPGIVGLGEALGWILERQDDLIQHDRDLRRVMLDELARLDALGDEPGSLGLMLLGPRQADERVGVFSLIHDTLTPAELAGLLEQEHGVLARAGLACAPRMHKRLGTASGGGALRFSIGPFTTAVDVRHACAALESICAIARGDQSRKELVG